MTVRRKKRVDREKVDEIRYLLYSITNSIYNTFRVLRKAKRKMPSEVRRGLAKVGITGLKFDLWEMSLYELLDKIDSAYYDPKLYTDVDYIHTLAEEAIDVVNKISQDMQKAVRNALNKLLRMSDLVGEIWLEISKRPDRWKLAGYMSDVDTSFVDLKKLAEEVTRDISTLEKLRSPVRTVTSSLGVMLEYLTHEDTPLRDKLTKLYEVAVVTEDVIFYIDYMYYEAIDDLKARLAGLLQYVK
ncbi:MAG: hypothetical protein ACK4SY_07685 [Pyrobaculum sp.]